MIRGVAVRAVQVQVVVPAQAVPVHLQVRVLAVHRPVRVVALVAVYRPRLLQVVQVVLLL